MARHLAYLDRVITSAIKKGGGRYIVTVPPRYGKSEYLSKYTPSWFVGKWPNKRVMLASYAEELAAEFGLAARNLIREFGSQYFGVKLDSSSQSKTHWKISGHNGGMTAAGVGGSLTGKGADLLIIDDPVKNAEEAASPTIREKHWNWWQSTAQTRLAPNATVIVIMTRWHQDDLAGRLLKSDEKDKWTMIRLPEICDTEDDLLGRKIGEPLWPEQWPLADVLEKQKSKTPYWWNAMHQGDPGQYGEAAWPAEYFEDIFTMDWPKKFVASAMAIDPALGKDKKRGDYSAIAFAGLAEGKAFVDVWLARIPPPELVTKAVTLWQILRPDILACEENGFQELLGPMFEAEVKKLGAFGCGVVPIVNSGNKITRIEATLTPLLQDKLIRFKARRSDNELCVEQMKSIPNGAHDDGPDAVQMAIRKVVDLVNGVHSENDPFGSKLVSAI